MPLSRLVWLLLAVAIIATIAGIWQLSNAHGYRTRGRRRDQDAQGPRDNRQKIKERMTDSRQLTRAEKKLYKESQRLLNEGKVAPAARILEQLNMPREAIQCLEDQGYIDDAARILMRLQRPNRAGVIYARHGQWDKAAQCFKIANMPLEVGKCARQANNPIMAAEYFEKAGYLIDAAKCYLDCKDYLRAARLFLRGNETGLAMASFSHLAGSRNCESISDPELKIIIDNMGKSPSDAGLADIIAQRNKLPEAIIELCRKGLIDSARELYIRATADIGPQLLAEIDYFAPPAKELANLLATLGKGQYAGIVYERMGDYAKAASTFENAHDYSRAAYCYERVRNTQKAKEMKAKAKNKSQSSNAAANSRSAFTLSDITSTDQQSSTDISHPDGVTSDPIADKCLVVADERDLVPSHPPQPINRVQQQPGPEIGRGNFSLNDADTNSKTTKQQSLADNSSSATEIPLPQHASNNLLRPSSFSTENLLDRQQSAFCAVNLFTALTKDEKLLLWNAGTTMNFNSGEDILNYGDECHGLYVIVEGTVYLFHLHTGRDQVIDTLSTGRAFGETYLLTDQKPSVRTIAAASTTIRLINYFNFHKVLDKNAAIAKKIYKQFCLSLIHPSSTSENLSKNQQAS